VEVIATAGVTAEGEATNKEELAAAAEMAAVAGTTAVTAANSEAAGGVLVLRWAGAETADTTAATAQVSATVTAGFVAAAGAGTGVANLIEGTAVGTSGVTTAWRVAGTGSSNGLAAGHDDRDRDRVVTATISEEEATTGTKAVAE
jgi:hypothetical protein